MSGYSKAANVDVSLRGSAEGLLSISWLLVFMSAADTAYAIWRLKKRALTVMYCFENQL